MRDYKIVNDHFAVINGEEVDINSMNFSNLMIQDESDKAIKEAVRHFLNFRPRCIDSETDSRFFYSKAQLRDFLKQFRSKEGDMRRIKCKVIHDDCGEFFCYEIYRERRGGKRDN